MELVRAGISTGSSGVYILQNIPPQGGGEDNLEIFTEGKIIKKVHAQAKRARDGKVI